jgi:hypothetical protein
MRIILFLILGKLFSTAQCFKVVFDAELADDRLVSERNLFLFCHSFVRHTFIISLANQNSLNFK